MALNLNDPLALAQAAQNVANNTGIGDEYRAEVEEYNTRQAAQELYDEAQRMKAEAEQMQQKSTEKKSRLPLIIGISAVAIVVIVVCILVFRKK